MTLNFDLTHDIDLGFSGSNFEIAVPQEWVGQLTWNEKDCESRSGILNPLCDLEL